MRQNCSARSEKWYSYCNVLKKEMTGSLLLLNLLAQVFTACFALFACTEAKNNTPAWKIAQTRLQRLRVFPTMSGRSSYNNIRYMMCFQGKNMVVRMGRAWHVENSFHSYQRDSKGDFILRENFNAYYQKTEQWIKVKFGGSSIASLNSSLTLNSTLNAHLVGKLYPHISYIHNKFRLLASFNIS